MASEHVDRFRDAMRAWNDQDWDALGAFYTPDAVLHHPDDWPEPGPTIGREAIIEQWKTTWQAFGQAEVSIERAEAEGGSVVAYMTIKIVGGGSGADAATDLTAVCRFEGTGCVEHRVVWGHQSASQFPSRA
jgi:ketosteroid isomerase-like protein